MRIAAFDEEVYMRCPMGKDGTKLLPGDTVYGEDGREWKLNAIGPTFCYADEGGRSYRLRTEWLTHERPDSWERLFGDLRDAGETGYLVQCGYYGRDRTDCRKCPRSDDDVDCMERFTLDLIERINRLREAEHD